ncbi:prepilin-type N-terminal cleavage/methylation domain-containing protein [Termitidicoccus mucosus]
MNIIVEQQVEQKRPGFFHGKWFGRARAGRRGFTLPEILLTLGVIAIFTSIVAIMALNTNAPAVARSVRDKVVVSQINDKAKALHAFGVDFSGVSSVQDLVDILGNPSIPDEFDGLYLVYTVDPSVDITKLELVPATTNAPPTVQMAP